MKSEMTKEERQEWVRKNLPECAAVAARFRDVFGDVRLVFAAENGHVLGKRSDGGLTEAGRLKGQ